MKRLLFAVLLGLLLIAGYGTAQDNQEEAENPDASATLMATLRSMPEFSSFVRLLDKTNLVADLNDGSSYTVFAPTNEALADRIDELGELDTTSLELRRFVRSYIVDRQITGEEMRDLTSLSTLEDTDLGVALDEDDLVVDDVSLDSTPILATNGIIYPIDDLLPSSLDMLE
jgi:uncharacterized surface protein with fasciclin (FAS1) repeats